MDQRDIIGERGEAIFRVLMTRKHPERGYLFDHPRFLGEKKQTIDFLVELFHVETLVPFFFVQVKSTCNGYTSQENRLQVQVKASEMQRLAAYPAPTYLVGIDEPGEKGYIISANGELEQGFSTMSTAHPLISNTLALLWDEVAAYWSAANHARFQSTLRDPKWKL